MGFVRFLSDIPNNFRLQLGYGFCVAGLYYGPNSGSLFRISSTYLEAVEALCFLDCPSDEGFSPIQRVSSRSK